MIMSHGEYMDSVRAKVNAAKGDLMGNGLRNEIGFAETAKRICNSAENLYFSMGEGVFEPVNSMFTAFSVRPGMNDVSNVAAVDIIDIGIQSTRQSVMGYLSAERAMSNPKDLAWYQTLVAVNDAGGLKKGETAFTPFMPITTKLNLGETVASATVLSTGSSDLTATNTWTYLNQTFTVTDGVLATDPTTGVITVATAGDAAVLKFPKAPIIAKQVSITFTKSVDDDPKNDIVITGTDIKGDGIFYFNNGSACTSAVIDYENGIVGISGIAGDDMVGAVVRVHGNVERTAEKDGNSTLKLKPKTTTIQLEAKTNRIILENSFEENAYINKQAFNLANVGVQMDFGRRAINQLLQAFTWYLDLTSINATWLAATKTMSNAHNNKPEILDLTDYLLSSSQAATKNDFVNQAMLRLNKALQKRTGKGATCYLVDTEAAIVLGNCETYFTGNPSFDTNLDGMIGTYRGIPVVRHHALDEIIGSTAVHTDYGLDNGLYGVIIAVYKSPDGQAAPSMYGEYLPPYSVLPALNYDNPSQFSQSILSMSTTEELVPELTEFMLVKVSQSTN